MNNKMTITIKQFNELVSMLTQLDSNSDLDVSSYIENKIGIELPEPCYTHLEEIIARMRYRF